MKRTLAVVLVLALAALAWAGQLTASTNYTAIVTGSEPPIGLPLNVNSSGNFVRNGNTYFYVSYPEPTGSYISTTGGGVWTFNADCTKLTFLPSGPNGMGPYGAPVSFDVTVN